MKKRKTKEWQNVPFKTWLYEPQTEMKHMVLKHYLPIWAKILGSYNNGLNYIDGFGGIGAYHTAEDLENNYYKSKKFGSPIFSIQAISSLKQQGKIDFANAIIIDDNQENIDNIKKIIDYLKLNRIKINYIKNDFDFSINGILDSLQGESIYPTFFLIDPFGFMIKLKTIERIFEFEKTEILINFMYNAIGRYLTHPNDKIRSYFDDLFGTTDWKSYIFESGEEKELALVNLFRKQCKNFANYVYPFKLNFPEKNRPYYYLFHLSNHYLGCKLMKEAFASKNHGEFEYFGSRPRQLLLQNFNDSKHETVSFTNLCSKCFMPKKTSKCAACLLPLFKSEPITYEKFFMTIVDLIPFTEKEIKKMLNKFEEDNILTVRSTRNRRSGFEKKDILIFHENGEY